MLAYQQGDRLAFNTLFGLLAPRVHGFFRRSFAVATADDLVQQTFLRLHQARAQFKAGSLLRPWLFAIAARVRLDELRRQKRHPEDPDDTWDASADKQAGPGGSAAPTATAEELLDEARRGQLVRLALEKLTEPQRALVHLHRYEGLTFAEIAAAFGTTEGAIKVRAFRAYERLRAELGPTLAASGDTRRAS